MTSQTNQQPGPLRSSDAQQRQRSAQHELWMEARKSVFYGLIALLASAMVFSLYVYRMPPLKVCCWGITCLVVLPCTLPRLMTTYVQSHELEALWHNFPPANVSSVITLRDTFLAYAESYPVRCCPAVLQHLLLLHSIPASHCPPNEHQRKPPCQHSFNLSTVMLCVNGDLYRGQLLRSCVVVVVTAGR